MLYNIATTNRIACAYIGQCLDVGSSLAKQSHHLRVVTLSSGHDQRGEPILSERYVILH